MDGLEEKFVNAYYDSEANFLGLEVVLGNPHKRFINEQGQRVALTRVNAVILNHDRSGVFGTFAMRTHTEVLGDDGLLPNGLRPSALYDYSSSGGYDDYDKWFFDWQYIDDNGLLRAYPNILERDISALDNYFNGVGLAQTIFGYAGVAKIAPFAGLMRSSNRKRQNRINTAALYLRTRLGKSTDDINTMLETAIDIDRGLRVKMLRKGDVVYRYERTVNSSPEKHFFTPYPVGATSVGFGSSSGYKLKKYELLQDVEVLDTGIKGQRRQNRQYIFDGNSSVIKDITTQGGG